MDWELRVRQQQEALAQTQSSRAKLRSTIEGLKQRVEALEGERGRLASGGAAADAQAQHGALESRLGGLQEWCATCGDDLSHRGSELAEAEQRLAEARGHAVQAAEEYEEQMEECAELEQSALAAEDAAATAEGRLRGMVEPGEVQRREAEAGRCRERLKLCEWESRQLRQSLAESLSSGADLPNALKELEVLRDSTLAASQRVHALEEFNVRLQDRVGQLEKEIAGLQKGAVDLESEGVLMREVLLEQSENFVRRVDDLADERRTVDEDRRQLLATTTALLGQVQKAEARIAKGSSLEAQCRQLEAAQKNLTAEVDRFRKTNDALCQQVLGEDGEGPLAGALTPSSFACDAEGFHDEIGRLVHGQFLSKPQRGDVREDAAALALRLQQLLAEREEAFWLEWQRLSDRVAAFEQRAGAQGRQSGAVPNGRRAGGEGGGSVGGGTAAAASAAAAAVTDGIRRFRGSLQA